MTLRRQLVMHLRPFWGRLSIILAVGLLGTPIALLMPLPLKIIVDSVLGDRPAPHFLSVLLPDAFLASPSAILTTSLILLLVVTALYWAQYQGTWLLSEYTGEQMVLRLRTAMFEQVQHHSLAYHDQEGLADATYRIQYDAPAVYLLVVWGIFPIVTALFIFLAMVIVMARVSIPLGLVALGISPVVIFLTWRYTRRLGKQWERVKRIETSALAVVQEVLGAIRVVKAFRQEERELHRFMQKSRTGVSERVRVVAQEVTLSFLVGMTFGVGTVLVLLVGVRQVQAGVITLGSLLLVMAYLNQLYGPLQTIGRQVVSQQGSLVSVRRAFELLNRGRAVEEKKDAKPVRRVEGAIAFRNVSFSYSPGRKVLHDVSFEVAPGARVGLSGATGSGKSTLMALLTRFYDPTEGEILLDGVDLRDYKLDDLRNQFAIVLQEPVLFSTSIAANIAYGRSRASFEEIVAAARAANVHEFIAGLPEGYETNVGERGAMLSGGERQRIALARAFLKDAPILILDEPTSSVDVATEALILDALKALMQGRTSFFITHRPGTLANCDIHLSLQEGRVTRGDRAPTAAGSRLG